MSIEPATLNSIAAARADAAGAGLRERLLRPVAPFSLKGLLTIVLIAIVYAWGINGTNAKPQEFIEGIPNIVGFFVRLFPPAVELSAVTVPILGLKIEGFPTIVGAIIQTVQIALIGTTASMILSLPFGLLAARNTTPHRSVYLVTRFILNSIRAVPELFWALVFVGAVGLGPFAGSLALSVASIGFMGKLYAESIEAIDPQQVLAVRATGAGRLDIFRHAVLPQALPLIVSYGLLLLESNIRAATVLGYVGGGGVGFTIQKYFALFQYQNLFGALLLIILMVTVVDRISDAIRKRII